MRLTEYLTDHSMKILFQICCGVVAGGFLLGTGTSSGIVLLLLLGWLLVAVIVMGVGYYRVRSKLMELTAVFEGLDKKYLLVECLDKPSGQVERQFYELMRRAQKSMIEEVSDAQARQEEYKEYIENWVHEVKVPITTIQLMCKNEKSGSSHKIRLQTGMIEEQVERALFYARLGSVERDFIIQKTQLTPLIHESIGKQKQLLMQNNVRIEIDPIDAWVYTDHKWLSFMLGQLLSNAVRYRKAEDPVIHFTAKPRESEVEVIVMDNGIGIAPHELPRIFDRGYTGSNGRSRGGSTGMGLYIARKLADHLQIKITVESMEGEYTRFHLWIPAGNLSILSTM